MKLWLTLCAVTLAACAVAAFDLGRPEAAMAAEAFATGDYENAARLYTQARKAATGDEAWMETTLALARAKVRLGDVAGARQLLDEFTKRFPAHSPGLLPGEILVGEGNISEAESYFNSFLGVAKDPEMRAAAKLALAYLDLRCGKLASAIEKLAKAEAYPRFRAEARLLRIYALIRTGRPGAAKKLISESADFPGDAFKLRLRILSLLADLRGGKAADFSGAWESLRPELKPRPDPLVLDLLDEAARIAIGEKAYDRAAAFLESAYDFADSDDMRKDVLRKLFNCHANYDAPRAAETAKRYAKYFPGASDRARLLSGAGRLLAAAGDHPAAISCFSAIIDDGDLFAAERYDAAADAAVEAEALGDAAAVRDYYHAMINAADTPAKKSTAIVRFAEYLLRIRDHAGAERILHRNASAIVPEDADRAGRLLVDALFPQGKYVPARRVAARLRRSIDAATAEFGDFYSARIAEKLGEIAEARRGYLDFAAKYPKSVFLAEARFSAALLADKLGERRTAAEEFLRYAADHPEPPFGDAAFFWAVRNLSLVDDLAAAKAAFDGIKIPGRAYYAAALELLEALRRNKQPEAALTFYDALDTSACNDDERAGLQFLRAGLLRDCGRTDEALNELSALIESHPRSQLVPDALLITGNLHFENRRFSDAAKAFREALVKRPGGRFGEVVSGRLADALFAQHGPGVGENELKEATGIFRKLAEEARTPAVLLQSLCKLGKCLYKQREFAGAVNAYRQALDYAYTLKQRGEAFDPSWCAQSFREALNVLVDPDFHPADRRQRGERIIEAYRKLAVPDTEGEILIMEKHFNEQCDKEK